jgi:hypothetical protein
VWRVRTLAGFEEVLVAEGRERVGYHLRELYARRVVIVSTLERLDEALERSAEFLLCCDETKI